MWWLRLEVTHLSGPGRDAYLRVRVGNPRLLALPLPTTYAVGRELTSLVRGHFSTGPFGDVP